MKNEMTMEEIRELERHFEDMRLRRGPFNPQWHRRFADLSERWAAVMRRTADQKEKVRNDLREAWKDHLAERVRARQ